MAMSFSGMASGPVLTQVAGTRRVQRSTRNVAGPERSSVLLRAWWNKNNSGSPNTEVSDRRDAYDKEQRSRPSPPPEAQDSKTPSWFSNWRANVDRDSSADLPPPPERERERFREPSSPSSSAPSNGGGWFSSLSGNNSSSRARDEPPPPPPERSERFTVGGRRERERERERAQERFREEEYAPPPVPQTVSLGGLNQGLTGLAFAMLSASSAVLAGLCIVAPQEVLGTALPTLEYYGELDPTFVRIIGATLLVSASVEWAIKDAVQGDRLNSPTYQRLMTGSLVKSVAYVVVLAVHGETFNEWDQTALVAYPALALTAAALQAAAITNSSGKGFALTAPEISLPKNPASVGYSIATVVYTLTAAACFMREMLFSGYYSFETPLYKAVWAPGFLLAAVVSYVLKDAADRDRLGASTFKTLNIGLFLLETSYAIIFMNALFGDDLAQLNAYTVPNLLGSVGLAGFAFYNAATAKKN